MRQGAPTAKKGRSPVAGNERTHHVTGAQAEKRKENPRDALAWCFTVQQPEGQPDQETHWKKKGERYQMRMGGTRFPKLADCIRDLIVAWLKP